jgi:hypothetical protein
MHITAAVARFAVVLTATIISLALLAQPVASASGKAPADQVTLDSVHGLTSESVPAGTTTITATIHIHKIGPTTYVQVYNANLGPYNTYFGVQSTTGEWTAIWSVFGFANRARVRLLAKSSIQAFGVNTKGDGTYSSVRTLVKRASLFVLQLTPTGDGWWKLVVNGHPVGAILVKSEASFQTQGSAWAEYWPNDYAAHPVKPPAVDASVTLMTS